MRRKEFDPYFVSQRSIGGRDIDEGKQRWSA